MYDFDMSLLPTAVDLTLYKYNYVDNKIWTQLNNQVDFINVSEDSIIVSTAQMIYFLEENYKNEINKFNSVGAEILHREIDTTFFLHQMCEEIENMQFIKFTLNNKKDYTRLIEVEGSKILQFNFKILSATLRLTDVYVGEDLIRANRALAKLELLNDDTPYLRIRAKELGSIIDTNMDEEDEDMSVLLDILDILEHKMERDNSLILLITDY
jgi:hypothetical protein